MTSAIIIDDEIDFVQVFEEILETMSISVIGKGKNGKETVELYEKHQPDLVFLDLMMPDYDGFFAIEKIANSAKIIMTTADVRTSSRERLQKLGIDSILYKPIEVSEISQMITKKLEIKS